jgi:hypothetical protein
MCAEMHRPSCNNFQIFQSEQNNLTTFSWISPTYFTKRLQWFSSCYSCKQAEVGWPAGGWRERWTGLDSDFQSHSAANLTCLNVQDRGLLNIQTGKPMLQHGYKYKIKLNPGI